MIPLEKLKEFHKLNNITGIEYPDERKPMNKPTEQEVVAEPARPQYYAETLDQMTKAVGEWSGNTFGDNVSKYTGQTLGPWPTLGVLASEVGELANAMACRDQGRKGFLQGAKFNAEAEDAVADIFITLCSLCELLNIDLVDVSTQTWNGIVSKRTIDNWEEHKHEIPDEEFESIIAQNPDILKVGDKADNQAGLERAGGNG